MSFFSATFTCSVFTPIFARFTPIAIAGLRALAPDTVNATSSIPNFSLSESNAFEHVSRLASYISSKTCNAFKRCKSVAFS